MQIASYYASVGFTVRKQDLKAVDAALRQIQKRLELFQKNIGKSLTLPELKIKKITLDSLSAQRTLQTELNRTGRLLELRIGNVRLDQNKITSQVQNVFQRAANNARMNVKTIAGTGGGGNPYHVPRLPQMNNGGVFGAGFGGGFGGSMLPRFGPGMMGAAGVGAAAVYGGQKINETRQLMSKRELERLQLEISVGGSAERRQSAIDVLIDLSNRLGINAEKQVDGFTKFMKQGQLSMGLSAQKAFDLYGNMAVATRGNGGDDQSVQRQAYALQQIGGLGYLRAEELNQQLADSAPAIRSYIIKAFAERTGQNGLDNFLKAMSKREVTFNDVMRAYELAAKDAAGKVKELANTVSGEEARFQNLKFAEELDHSKGAMTSAAREFAKSQAELYKAMTPLRDSFYALAAAGTSVAAKLVSGFSGKLATAPALNGLLTNEQRSLAPMASSMGRGMLSVPDIRVLNQPSIPQFLSPMPVQQKEWQKAASEYVRPGIESILPSMRPAPTVNSNIIVPITVHTTAADGNALARELEPHMRELFRRETISIFQGVMIENPDME